MIVEHIPAAPLGLGADELTPVPGAETAPGFTRPPLCGYVRRCLLVRNFTTIRDH
jgi:hypothetical protein